MDLWNTEKSRRFLSDNYWRQPHVWNKNAKREGRRARDILCVNGECIRARERLAPLAAATLDRNRRNTVAGLVPPHETPVYVSTYGALRHPNPCSLKSLWTVGLRAKQSIGSSPAVRAVRRPDPAMPCGSIRSETSVPPAQRLFTSSNGAAGHRWTPSPALHLARSLTMVRTRPPWERLGKGRVGVS